MRGAVPLDDASLARMATQPFTYPEVGRTEGALPDGYLHVRMDRTLGTGRDVFEKAAHRLMTWQMHAASGLTVRSSTAHVRPSSLVILGVRLGPVRVNAPCRVVYVVDDAGRQGFAYGTLPGHPERGEESFVVAIGVRGEVTATITAFSRPASLLARVGGPVTGRMQARATVAYLDALTG